FAIQCLYYLLLYTQCPIYRWSHLLYDTNSSHVIESSSIVVFDNSTPIPEYHNLRDMSDAHPSSEITSDAPIHSAVKWFNRSRGFGFIVLSDGSGEAFIHRNVLAQSGIDALEPGAVLKVRVVRGNSRRKVLEVLSVDSSSAVPATKRRPKTRSNDLPLQEIGTVTSYKTHWGY